MASIPTHAFFAVGLTRALKSDASVGLLARSAALACLADLDVVGLLYKVPYDAPWGHRGATHSCLAAAVLALAGGKAYPLLLLAALTHPFLDMLTDGGRGVAFLWPYSAERYFLPWRPIPVSPIGANFFSERGLHVLSMELLMIWAPTALLLWLSIRRKG
ncbi:MAG: metal-dependent hydrolase [Elusimicrobia bacterium]|nr:metal-dependent hydrolase [Elusimicrobiota bacterium]